MSVDWQRMVRKLQAQVSAHELRILDMHKEVNKAEAKVVEVEMDNARLIHERDEALRKYHNIITDGYNEAKRADKAEAKILELYQEMETQQLMAKRTISLMQEEIDAAAWDNYETPRDYCSNCDCEDCT